MRTVKDLLADKPNTVWHTSPDTSVYDALALMSEKNIGALPVLRDGKLEGIFSERDYARKVILKGKSSKDIPVSEIMTENVFSIRPDQTIAECMGLMTDKHIRHLPVVEQDRVVGVISIGDVVKDIIADQRSTIDQLEHYISGR